MSASNEWFEYHLTNSNGWVKGSERLDFSGVHSEPVPEDRVLTLSFHERLSSIYSKKSQQWCKETFRIADEDLVRTLIEKYGEYPSGYSSEDYPKI